MITCKSQRELAYMKDAGRIAARAHEELAKAIRPGVTTKELDEIAADFIISRGGRPAFKGLYDFPANICTSINEEVVHGIPSPYRRLQEGDIISIDIGVELNGYFGDCARTFPVGDVSEATRELLRVAEEALYRGIAEARVGRRLSDISHAIQSYVEAHGFSVVREFVGHGIGTSMHEEPQVPNFGPPGRGPRLKPGMTLAIEPMVNMGTHEVVTLDDNWTVVTKDLSLSAHFEHTVAVTNGRPEILTLP